MLAAKLTKRAPSRAASGSPAPAAKLAKAAAGITPPQPVAQPAFNPAWARLALGPGLGLAPKRQGGASGDPSDVAADGLLLRPDAILPRQNTGGELGPTEVAADFTSRLGSGQPLDSVSRAFFEPRFVHDFSGVRIHAGTLANAAATSLQARAFTSGRDVVFAAGELNPRSERGKRLLAHELTHVVQQSRSDHNTPQKMAVAPSASPAEREADDVASRVVQGLPARRLRSAPPSIQRAPGDPAPQGNPKPTLVSFQIAITETLSAEQFKLIAMKQVFGGPVANIKWQLSKTSFDVKDSPIPLGVELLVLQKHRAQANQAKGIATDDTGAVVGAQERATAFQGAPAGTDKEALMAEIDRRFSAATGSSDRILAGETGKADLWKAIRDELLFQHETIANLPPSVKLLIGTSIKGRDLTPADYDQLFRIAKKIEAMPAGQAADYASKVTGTTTDLSTFETSVDGYAAKMAERKKASEAHNETMTKLEGLQGVYRLFRAWQTLEMISPGSNQDEKAELEKQLKAHDFAGTAAFENYIDQFLTGFATESAKQVLDVLDKYAGRLYREGERYKDPTEVSALHAKLGGVREQYKVFKTNEAIYAEQTQRHDQEERSRLPGNGGTRPAKPYDPAVAKQALAAGTAARDNAAAQVKSLEPEHPVFQEDGLSLDRRIDKSKLATADETQLGAVLAGYIATRKEAVKDARGELDGKADLIYRMEKMMPQFYLQQGIKEGSVHDLIIKDKMREDMIQKIVVGILVAIVAIALTVVSLGTATPALIAAGAAAGAFGLSAYQAYEEYKEYSQNQKLAGVGLVDDPSVVWLVIAIAGAALDMGAAVKAVRALGPAAKALNAGSDLVKFNKAVRTLEQASEIDAKIARAAEKAGAAKKSYAEASTELGKILGSRAYGFPGPFTDPDVYKQLVKMAAAKFKEIGNNGLIFIEEIKKARALAKLADMTPEELAKVKQAWEEGKALADTAKELAPSAEKIAELKKALSPLLPAANDLSGKALVMINKLDKTLLPKLKSASAADLERLGAMLVEDPTLADRLLKYKNPLGALKKSSTLVEMDRAMIRNRLGELKVNPDRIAPALDRTGLSATDLAKLSDADMKALGQGDRLLAEAGQNLGPGQADAAKLAQAQIEFDKLTGVSKAARDDIRASVAHSHGISDLPFMRNPGETLAARFPTIPKTKMDVLVKRHPDALRALESATQDEVEKIIKALEESANPKDVEDILRSYVYKAQKKARKAVSEGGTGGRLDVPENTGERIGESLDNLAQARKQGHPFGFKDKASYDSFISTVDSEITARGIKGRANVQGSAMHSKTPGDIDMKIDVDQAEFDRLSKKFLDNAPSKKERDALAISIKKNKIPSYEFFPDHNPSIGSTVRPLTLGADGKPLEVQATLIVKGSDFDLGPSL